jgi:hypothetical protein
MNGKCLRVVCKLQRKKKNLEVVLTVNEVRDWMPVRSQGVEGLPLNPSPGTARLRLHPLRPLLLPLLRRNHQSESPVPMIKFNNWRIKDDDLGKRVHTHRRRPLSRHPRLLQEPY